MKSQFCSVRSWGAVLLAGFVALVGPAWNSAAAEGRLASSLFVRVAQSADAAPANSATRAMDGTAATFSLTANVPGSYWTAVLGRPYPITRIEIVNRTGTDAVELQGLTLRLSNLDDQTVHTTTLANPGSGGTAVVNVPAGLTARTLWIGLSGNETNGAGNYRVGLAEVRVFGVLDIPYGPPSVAAPTNEVQIQVRQSSEYPGYPAGNAIDGNTGNFTHTANLANSYWMADLGRATTVTRVEIVNRLDCCAARLGGLVLRIFDASSNSIWSAGLVNVGLGGVSTHTPPAGTSGRWIRVGLENNQFNNDGNYYISLAEARVYSGTTNVLASPTISSSVVSNLASFKPAYMLRLTSTVPSATNANDNNFATETKTTTATVDGYWETDLGATYALYGVRSIAASGITYRLTNAIVRLYNEAHESVYARKITGAPDVFDTDVDGPIFARYVRVGLEDKQRTDPAGGIEFYIGFREVEVFGRPTNSIGIQSFTASSAQVQPGQPVTISWNVEDVRRVELHPGIGSVGEFTETNGAGSITLAVTNSTEFVLVASNAAGIFSRGVSVTVDSSPPPTVRLSEFVAENKYSLKDGDGEAADWIELRNTGNTPINLAGYGLSDEPAQPMKWVFPETILAAHATLVIFASGRETSPDSAGHLHASFRLDKAGGALVLTSPSTNTVDAVPAYPEQDTDLAYGRDLQGQWTFLEPTPGAANSAPAYSGWLRPPEFSHARGFYETPFTLSISNHSPSSTLVYSLDGTPPALPFPGSLEITNTRAVRVQAVRPGYRPARAQTKTFIFIDGVIASPVMNTSITRHTNYAPRLRPGLLSLPTISLCVPGEPEYEEKEGSVEVLWPDGGNGVQINAGISRFGNAWTKFAKRSFRIKCRSRYGDSRLNVPLFTGFDRGVLAQTSFDELDLRSGSQDMVERGFYMAARFVEDSMLDMGSLNPHGRYVHVYVNGVYWGQYDARELMVEPFMADYLGGRTEDYVVVRGNDNVGDNFALGAPEPPNILPWERVLSLRNSYHGLRPYVDMSHFLDFLLLWNYGNCESEYRACGPIDAGSGFKFWIADADGFLRTSAVGLNRTVRNGPGDIFSGLIAENNSDFKTLLADRIYRHFFNGGALTPAANDARLAARMQEIRDSLVAECARWNYRTPTNWVTEANLIRNSLFPTRTAELLTMARSAGWYPAFDPPVFTPYGGVVTNGFQPQLAVLTGTIYYTLDGSDPRSPGGGIAPGALVWSTGAVTITDETLLSVRVRNASGQWSALAQPRYVLPARRPPAARDLLVTEVHYHPADSDEYEFVELFNASGGPLNMSGVSLSNGVRFMFPNGFTLRPGAFTLIVDNAAAFAQRYQTPGSPYFIPGLNVAGEWSGALANEGEAISLIASNGVVLTTVDYQPGGEWPGRADGEGSSLELRTLPAAGATDADVRSLVNDSASWTSSALYHGSPGRLDNRADSIRLNEILSHSLLGEDWLELYNAGTQQVSLAGVTITDNLDLPTRFSFAEDAVLAPGQYLLLNASQLGFAFGEMGERAALLQTSGTNILRFLDTVDFPAAAAEEPFGVFTRLDGRSDFRELAGTTPGAPNAPARVGPLIISEILFQPAPDRSPFIEIQNLTNIPVALYDPAHPTNIWSLEGVGTFQFPPGTIVPSSGTILVCATNAPEFRAQYGLADAVPVFGPWTGGLDRDGEALRLMRPGAPQTNGLPRYRVDHVSYRVRPPWPPITPGLSFQKTIPAGYGNDTAHWTAAVPTPGTALPPGPRPIIVSPPQNVTVNEGEDALFSAVATGPAPLFLQWRFQGSAIPGATNSTLLLENALITHAGAYDVAAFGPAGSVISAPATLIVIKPPTITRQPVPVLVRPGSNTVLTVNATGTGALRYQWRLNGFPVAGATNAALPIVNATLAVAGIYTVVITDDLGSIVSAPATLSVLIDPFIVQQPLSQSVATGGTVTLSISVTNTATLPVGFRWRRTGSPNIFQVLDRHTSFLTLTNVTNTLSYSVVVTNFSNGLGLLSSNAVITVLSDLDADSLPDEWELTYQFNPADAGDATGDADGDTVSNRDEYLAGTDPRDPASYLRIDGISAGLGATLTFGAMSNRTYSLQAADTPGPGAWTRLIDIPARPTNRVELMVDPVSMIHRIYRLVTPQQP